MITLESLLNNDNSSNINECINLEDYSFELSNYTMECSDIMCEINTLEAASIVCEDGENKKNIFKKALENIKELFKKLMEFFKSIIYKSKRQKTDNIVDMIISKIKKGENTEFIYTSNPYVDVLYKEKFDKNDIKTYVDTMNSFISNIQKSIEELESHIAKNDETKFIDAVFEKIKNDIDNVHDVLGRSKFTIAIKKYNEDFNEHYNKLGTLDKVFYTGKGSPSIFDEKVNRVSKDELINRLMWIKTVYIESVDDIGEIEINVSRLDDKCKSLYERFRDFNDTYLSISFKNLQDTTKMIYKVSLKINLLMNSLLDEVKRISQII